MATQCVAKIKVVAKFHPFSDLERVDMNVAISTVARYRLHTKKQAVPPYLHTRLLFHLCLCLLHSSVMGLNGKIKKQLKEHFSGDVHDPATLLFQKNTLMLNPNKVAVVVDYLCYYQGIDRTKRTTAIDLAWMFWHVVMEYLRNGTRVDVVVMCCDYKPGVTVYKAKTQSARVEATASSYEAQGLEEAVPYPSDATFNEEGKVCYDDEVEYIDMRRLGMSKDVRAKLWPFYHSRIKDRMRSVNKGTVFFFDYDASGPWMFVNNGMDDVTEMHRPDLAHALGEADPALMWWTKLLQTPKRDVYLMSTDSDLIALYLLYRSRYPRFCSTVWWHSDKTAVFDLSSIYKQFQAKVGMTPILFAFMCTLLGTDFVKKNLTTDYLNEDKVFAAAQSWTMPSIKEKGWRGVMTDFLCHLYNTEYNAKTVVKVPPKFVKPPIVLSIEELRKAFPPRVKRGAAFPTEDQIKQASDLVAFNMLYWYQASDGVSWENAAGHMLQKDGKYLHV